LVEISVDDTGVDVEDSHGNVVGYQFLIPGNRCNDLTKLGIHVNLEIILPVIKLNN